VPGRWSVVGATIASLAGWLLTVACFVSVAALVPEIGWVKVAYLGGLCAAPQIAIVASRHARAARRQRAAVPASLLERRLHGNLDSIQDDGRLLRSVGAAAGDVAARTGAQLAKLIENPCVHIFHGVRVDGARGPAMVHAVTAGHSLLLVESVAWPTGCYRVDRDGRVSCDDRYIGQSIAALLAAVRYWRSVLPRTHRVSALVVVYGATELPGPTRDLAWAGPGDLLSAIHRRLPERRMVSTHLLTALAQATAIDPREE
jgi:hypothetical protein